MPLCNFEMCMCTDARPYAIADEFSSSPSVKMPLDILGTVIKEARVSRAKGNVNEVP
jgi:hypothetical protein